MNLLKPFPCASDFFVDEESLSGFGNRLEVLLADIEERGEDDPFAVAD